MDPQTEPSIDELRALRRALLDGHRALLQTQRAEVEQITGPMSPHEALGAAISDPRFAWLRALSELITQIDSYIADDEREPGVGAELEERARARTAPKPRWGARAPRSGRAALSTLGALSGALERDRRVKRLEPGPGVEQPMGAVAQIAEVLAPSALHAGDPQPTVVLEFPLQRGARGERDRVVPRGRSGHGS